METVIKKINSTYSVSNESESLKMEGQLVYSNKIDNLNLGVYSLDGNYLGNISYQEYGENNTSLNCSVGLEYMMPAITLLQVIIADRRNIN